MNGSESLIAIVMIGAPGSTSMLKLKEVGVTALLGSTWKHAMENDDTTWETRYYGGAGEEITEDE